MRNELHAFDTTNAWRKSAHQYRVECFMARVRELSGRPPLPSHPQVPDGKMILTQMKLILEEALEVIEACGCTVHVSRDAIAALTGLNSQEVEDLPLLFGELSVKLDESEIEIYLPDVAKELADLSVVTTGTFSEFGIADVPVLEAIDQNNLMKFADGGYLDENNKWRKPPNHPKPDIRAVLVMQGFDRPETAHEVPDVQDVSVSSRDDGQT